MVISIALLDPISKMLNDRAKREGIPPEALASRLIAQAFIPDKSLAEVVAPLHAAAKASGLTDLEMDELFQQAIDESRRSRREVRP